MKSGTLVAALFGAGLVVTSVLAATQEPSTPAPAALADPHDFCPPCAPRPPLAGCHMQIDARRGDLWKPAITLDLSYSVSGFRPRETTLYRARYTMCAGAPAPVYFVQGAGDDCSVTMPPLPGPCPPFEGRIMPGRAGGLTSLTFPTPATVPTLKVSQERWNGRDWEPVRTHDLPVRRTSQGGSTVSFRDGAAGIFRLRWEATAGHPQETSYEVTRP